MADARRRGRRFGWRTRLAVLCLAAAALAWTVGLIGFAERIPEQVDDVSTPTDAIVVLTGGSRRVEAGLRLLAEGKGRHVFVTGMHPSAGVDDLLARSVVPKEEVMCCVEAGYDAANTAGNAAETAAWMRTHGFSSLRLVTSSYHMPRSMLEMQSALPEALVIPHPVFPPRVETDHWWQHPETTLLIAREYTKYLLARARLWAADMVS